MSLNLIKQLVPKTYKFRDFNTPRMRAGFIAQEVEDVLHSMGLTTEDWALVNKSKPGEEDNEKNSYSLNYIGLIAPMVKVIQCLTAKINALEKKLTN